MAKYPRDLKYGVIHDCSTGAPAPFVVPNTAAPSVKAIVFVHGILSDHTTYAMCYFALAVERPDWRFYYVDYNYNEPIADNGQYLATALRQHFNDSDRVVIVAHSMGGIVARYACLSHPLPFVRTLFLLGSPNHGAFRTSSLGILAQMTRGVVGKLWGVRPKKVGIFDLTRVDGILGPLLKHEARTGHIDYVTIPGRYFHKERGFFAHSSVDMWRVIFGGLDVGSELVRAFLPLLSIKMQRAHDGIVEETSNQLVPDDDEQASEKLMSFRRPGGTPATYAHVRAVPAKKLMHVQITGSDFVISIIDEILDEPCLDTWIPTARGRYARAMKVQDRDF
jgi:pimeloyl-ACP methyl ester carboxylesterase